MFNWHQLFEATVIQSVDRVAVIFEDRQLTYGELNAQANQVAHYLRQRGMARGDLVGICVERSLDMIVGLLGILKAGGAYLPLDPTYPKERLAFMLEDAKAPLLLTQEHLLPQIPHATTQTICLDTDWEEIAQESQENLIFETEASNLAYVIYTSGSTGKPKGVAIAQESLVNFVESAIAEYEIDESDRVLQFASISFDAAVEEIFTTLVQGATLVLRTREMLRSISVFLEACYQLEITVLDLPTAFWHQVCAELANQQSELPESVRLVIIGGERALPQWLDVWQQFVPSHVRLVNTYGPTEGTVVATLCDIGGARAVDTISRVLPIGKPMNHVQVYVLDENLQTVPSGKPGELYIGGTCLAREYLNRSDLTQEKFIPHPFSEGDRLYKTGDLVRYREDGHLEFLSRIDTQEKIRGFRVELSGIETVLEEYPSVREAVVMAREDIPGDKRLVAYLVPNEQDQTHLALYQQLEAQQVSQWETIHDADSFNPADAQWEDTFNISGWYSSYTGEPLPDEEMRQWLDHTVSRILALKPDRVLEIGCGTGLILFQVAPQCTQYQGTDISGASLSHIERQLSKLALPQVSIAQRTADNFAGMAPQSFDTVIINSVIQYFPTLDYLVRVIEDVIDVIAPGGSLFLGDLRSFPLLSAFYAAVELHQANDSLPAEELQRRIQKRCKQEEELTIDPTFFFALQHYFPQITGVRIQPKQGSYCNELTQFRYDVILEIRGVEQASIEPQLINWQQEQPSLTTIKQIIQQNQPAAIAITHISNAKVWREVKTLALLAHHYRYETVGELKEILAQSQSKAIDPAQWDNLASELGYQMELSWNNSDREGSYDVLLFKPGLSARPKLPHLQLPQPKAKPAWNLYGNNPLQGKVAHNLVPKLRRFLKEKLPDYMIPSAFVVLDRFPLTANGKLDRRALPAPATTRPNLERAYVAPRTEVEATLEQLWSDLLGLQDLGIDDNFFELGGHSLLTTQMIAQVESAFHLVLPLVSFFKNPTIAGLAEVIALSRNPDAVEITEFMTLEELKAEAILDETIYFDSPYQEIVPQIQQVFLTGSSGFLGAFLLDELLQQTEANIYCLVRAATITEARQRIRTNLEKCQIWQESFLNRIIPVLGDLSQPFLGLREEQFHELATNLDVIYHNGASVNLLYPYNALKATNVLGTKEILRLAARIKVKPVHLISTLDVFESAICSGIEIIKEDECITQGKGMVGGYAQSKWVAEKLMLKAYSKGIPITIYRPGMISGHSQTGISNTDDLTCRVIKGFIQMGQAPDLDLALDFTPVDYASKAIIYLSQQKQSPKQTFHLLNPAPVPLSQLLDLIRSLGYSVEQIPYQEWQTALRKSASQLDKNALSPLASILLETVAQSHLTRLEMWLAGSQLFDCQNTIAGLRGSHINCPLADEKLLTKYFSFFQKSGFLPSMSGIKV